MRITIKKNIGNKQYIFDIDKPDFNEAYREAAKVDMLPSVCNKCGCNDLSLTFKKPQGYVYPGIKCNNPECNANTVIQGKKDGSEDYVQPMKTWEEQKAAREQRQQPIADQVQQEVQGTVVNNSGPFDDSGIPF